MKRKEKARTPTKARASTAVAQETEKGAAEPEHNPAHKEDFTRLLNVAARKREQED
jgi:hypothetical protein